MMVYKYIITDDGAILFPEAAVHSVIAEGYKKIKKPVYSAGFVKVHYAVYKNSMGIQVECYGKSESLKLESQPKKDNIVVSDFFADIPQIKYGLLIVKELYL